MAVYDINWSARLVGPGPFNLGVGVPMCPDSSTGTQYVVANAANLAAIGRYAGLSITVADPVTGIFAIQYSGEVSNTITGLGPGAKGPVVISTTGGLQRKSTPVATDYVVGTADQFGNMTLANTGGAGVNVVANASLYLTQPDWYIDPVSGLDTNDGKTLLTAIQTGDELARRLGIFAQLNPTGGVMTVHVAGDISFSNGISINSGFPVVWTSTAATSQATGTVSGVIAGSSTREWNANLGVSPTTHLNRRIRITSGARAGTVAWIQKDLGGNVARLSETVTTSVPPLANVGILTIGLSSFVNGDPYVIETMPTVTFFGPAIFQGEGGTNFVDLHVAGSSQIGGTGEFNFYRCRFVDLMAPADCDGSLMYFLACGFDNGVLSQPGGQLVCLACSSTAIHEILAFGQSGGAMVLDYRCQAQGAGIGNYGGAAGTMIVGSARVYDCGVHIVTNPTGTGLVCPAGTAISLGSAGVGADTPFLTGSGHVSTGAYIAPGAIGISGTYTPTLTGPTNDVQVDLAVRNWPAAPFQLVPDHGTTVNLVKLTRQDFFSKPYGDWQLINNANIDASAAIAVSKLAAGAANTVITMVAGIATWSLISNVSIAAGAAIDVSKLAAGTNTFVLTTVAGVPTWAAPAAGGITQLTSDVLAGPGSGSVAATVVQLTGSGSNVNVVSGTSLSFLGATSVASTGNIRFPKIYNVLARNNANSSDATILSSTGTDDLSIGSNSLTTMNLGNPSVSLFVFATQVAIECGGNTYLDQASLVIRDASHNTRLLHTVAAAYTMTWDASCTSVTISQANTAVAATAADMTIQAQSGTGAVKTHGGSLHLNAGDGVTGDNGGHVFVRAGSGASKGLFVIDNVSGWGFTNGVGITATTASIGTSGAPPAQVQGYLITSILGGNYKIPYYNT